MMGVRLELDLRQLEGGPVEEERALLAKARNGKEIEAAQLLLRYEAGQLQDAVVKAAVVCGQSVVTRAIAVRALENKPKGRARPITPRSFFVHIDAEGKRGVKGDPNKRLALLAEAGELLTETDALNALAGKPQPIKLHRLEGVLVAYVKKKHNGVSDEQALSYVHRSFPNNPWLNDGLRNADVTYEAPKIEFRAISPGATG